MLNQERAEEFELIIGTATGSVFLRHNVGGCDWYSEWYGQNDEETFSKLVGDALAHWYECEH